MALITNIILFALSCFVLITSGSYLIKSLSKIASFLKMSEFVVSFIILGMATSLPELFVGISAALIKQPAIALGNVIGSNIANLTIILGIPILLAKGLNITSKTTKKDSIFMMGIAAIPLILMVIGQKLSRIDGIILIVIFFAYTTWLVRQRKGFSKQLQDGVGRWEVVKNMLIFVISFLVLYFSAKFTVKYASLISTDLALPPIFIGLVIIALGTSLPELVVGTQAAMQRKDDILLGNIIGSVVANSTLILGVTAIIYPITANLVIFFTGISFMILTALLFTTFVESGNKLYLKEGIAMIILYFFFIMFELYMKNISSLI